MNNYGNLDLYTHKAIDTDLSTYRVINAECQLYIDQDLEINALFKRFQANLDQTLFIKHNRLFFTLNGVKYWTILSTTIEEWTYINDLIQQLQVFVADIAYMPGELD